MRFQAEIIDISTPVAASNGRGGSYRSVEVAYKRDGKVEGKKLVDFTNKEIFELVSNLKRGDQIEVDIEKDAKNYWQWVGVATTETAVQVPVFAKPQAAQESAQRVPDTGGATEPAKVAGRVTGSNYETPEERAIKQHYIVRQSSLTAAVHIAVANQAGKAKVDPKDVVELAEKLHNYVFSGENPFATGFSDLKDDLPF